MNLSTESENSSISTLSWFLILGMGNKINNKSKRKEETLRALTSISISDVLI
jgi:hypothetical protein